MFKRDLTLRIYMSASSTPTSPISLLITGMNLYQVYNEYLKLSDYLNQCLKFPSKNGVISVKTLLTQSYASCHVHKLYHYKHSSMRVYFLASIIHKT